VYAGYRMSQPETRQLPSGLTVNIFRPTVAIAPLSNKQTKAYLENLTALDQKDTQFAEKFGDLCWQSLCDSVNNAKELSGDENPATVDALRGKFGDAQLIEMRKVIMEISGFVESDQGEASAAQSKSEDISGLSAAA
jgi:hypothetical protein